MSFVLHVSCGAGIKTPMFCRSHRRSAARQQTEPHTDDLVLFCWLDVIASFFRFWRWSWLSNGCSLLYNRVSGVCTWTNMFCVHGTAGCRFNLAHSSVYLSGLLLLFAYESALIVFLQWVQIGWLLEYLEIFYVKILGQNIRTTEGREKNSTYNFTGRIVLITRE